MDYPLSRVTIPNEATSFIVVATGNSISSGVAPNLTVEHDGITYDWEEIVEGEADSETLPFSISGILKVYNGSFAWNLSITRA